MVNVKKLTIQSLLILSFMTLSSFILFGISSVITYLNTGADRSKMFHTEIQKEAQYIPKLSWAPLQNEGRKMDSQTLKELEKNYLDAWYARHICYEKNTKKGLENYYTDSAEKNLFNFIDFNKANKIHIEATTLNHHPEVNFFSEDGQLVVLTDRNVREYKRIHQDELLIHETSEYADYKVILLLENGFWRIRHLVKQPASASLQQVRAPIPYPDFHIRGINYYPQATPWDTFGGEFNSEIISNDLQIIKDANLNTVRIFVQYEDFGKAQVPKGKIEKLKKLLDIAEEKQLKVIVTLFDFYGDYSVLDWTQTQRHIETICTAFKGHDALLAWDLKNEPDLDFESRGKELVLSWLKESIQLIKKTDPKHLVTVGWAKIENAVLPQNELDLISFHYYEDITHFETAYQKLKLKIPNKPIALGEYGISSYRGFWYPFGNSERSQAKFHKTMQTILEKNNVQFLSWTLYDYKKIPKEVVGKLPWRKYLQKRYGFIDTHGKPKKAFSYISSSASTE